MFPPTYDTDGDVGNLRQSSAMQCRPSTIDDDDDDDDAILSHAVTDIERRAAWLSLTMGDSRKRLRLAKYRIRGLSIKRWEILSTLQFHHVEVEDKLRRIHL